MSTEQTPNSTTNNSTETAGAEGEALSRSIAGRTGWIQRALSPWSRRWLPTASSPADKGQTSLESHPTAPLTVHRTTSLLQHVQRVVEVGPVGRSSLLSAYPLRLGGFSGAVINRFPDTRHRFEPHPPQNVPAKTPELVLAGTGETAAEEVAPQPEPEGFKPFTSFDDFMNALEAKRHESEGGPPAPAQPSAPVQRKPAIQPGPYNKPFTSMADFLQALEAAKSLEPASADTPSDQPSPSAGETSPAASVQRESVGPGSASSPPFPSPRRPRPRARVEEVTPPTGNLSGSALPESKGLSEIKPESPPSNSELNRPASEKLPLPTPGGLPIESATRPSLEPMPDQAPEVQRTSGLESLPDETQQGEIKTRPVAAGQAGLDMPLRLVKTDQPAPELSSGEIAGVSDVSLPVEMERPTPETTSTETVKPSEPPAPPFTAGQPTPSTPAQRMPEPGKLPIVREQPASPSSEASRSEKPGSQLAAQHQPIPESPAPEMPATGAKRPPQPEASTPKGTQLNPSVQRAPSSEPEIDEADEAARPDKPVGVPSEVERPVPETPLRELPPVEGERPAPSVQRAPSSEPEIDEADDAARPGKPVSVLGEVDRPRPEMPLRELPPVEAERPAPSVQRAPSSEPEIDEAARPDKPVGVPGEVEQPRPEMPLREFPPVEGERPAPSVQRAPLSEPEAKAVKPGKPVGVPGEVEQPRPEMPLRELPPVEGEGPAPSVQRAPSSEPEAGSDEAARPGKPVSVLGEVEQPRPEMPLRELPPVEGEGPAPSVQRAPLSEPEAEADEAARPGKPATVPVEVERPWSEMPLRELPPVEGEGPVPSVQRAPLSEPEAEADEAARPGKPVSVPGEVERPRPEMPLREFPPVEAERPAPSVQRAPLSEPEAGSDEAARPGKPATVSGQIDQPRLEMPLREIPSKPVQRQPKLPLDTQPIGRDQSPAGQLAEVEGLDRHILAKAEASAHLPLLESGPQLSRMIQRSLTKSQSQPQVAVLPQMRAQLHPAGADDRQGLAEESDFPGDAPVLPTSRSSERAALPLVPPIRVEIIERSPAPAVVVPPPPVSPSPALLSVQRQIASPEAAAAQPVETGPAQVASQLIQRVITAPEVSSEQPGTKSSKVDLDKLARQIYPLIKRMLAVERDRRPIH